MRDRKKDEEETVEDVVDDGGQEESDGAIQDFWSLSEEDIKAMEAAGMKGDPDPGANQRQKENE